MLSTYPPRVCGLATFAAALEVELARAGDDVTVVAISDGAPERTANARPQKVLVNGSAASVRETAAVLSECDVVIIQHEFGVYGGVDGDEVVDILRMLDVRTVVVLHTVLLTPIAHQRSVMERICALADAVVVMSAAARARLVAGHAVDASKVTLIPHGAWSPSAPVSSVETQAGPLQLLTWGLLGPGKGIEHVIRAISIGDLARRVRYTVAGVTHPNVLARDGDVYRQSLIRAARATGVDRSVDFDDTYRDVAALRRLVTSTSVVVLPYDSRDQVTSGVLVDAIAAGRPVIATPFPHAVEMLSGGAGIVVPHNDADALSAAIHTLTHEPAKLRAMTARAREIAPTLAWSSVARQYQVLCDTLVPIAAMAAS